MGFSSSKEEAEEIELYHFIALFAIVAPSLKEIFTDTDSY